MVRGRIAEYIWKEDREMPIKRCTTKDGKNGYKWGDSGACYENREDALKQMRAIKYSQTHSIEAEVLQEHLKELLDSKDKNG